MVRYMSDLAKSKISMISEISVVQKNIGSSKTRKFRWKYPDIMDILDHGLNNNVVDNRQYLQLVLTALES